MAHIPPHPGLASTAAYVPGADWAAALDVDGGGPDASNTDRMRVALEQTLSIATATTESELLLRALVAAYQVSGAQFAAMLEPDGTVRVHGDPLPSGGLARLPERLAYVREAVTNVRESVSDARDGGTSASEALATIGLPGAYATMVGESLILLAPPEPDRFDQHTDALLALLFAQVLATRSRLRELGQLSKQAESDPLTGLRHSRPFVKRLNASPPGRTAIIAVDVDDFKRINDEYGHQAGDHALLSLVDSLRAAMRGDDQLYRIGGDEFAVIVDVNGPAEVVAISRRLLEAARQVGQTVSVGAAVRMAGETGPETLRRADKALYQAKRAGRDTARLAPSRARFRIHAA